MTTENEPTRWRLQAWGKAKELIYDDTCVGDRALDDALRRLEKRADYKRHRVSPESRTARVPIAAAEGAPPPDPSATPPACRECELPEHECRRRSNVSGHGFIPTGGAR